MHTMTSQSQCQGFHSIIDKYLKANDFAMLHAYLMHVETGEPNESLFKTTKSTVYTNFANEGCILAQKTYKFILCIDYSELSSLDLISKAIDTFFDKLSTEYGEFVDLCTSYTPKIYLSVILWHPTYFRNLKKSFTMLVHSKYLAKRAYFPIYSAQVYEKILEFKATLVKLKHNEDDIANWLVNNDAMLTHNNHLMKYFMNYDRYSYYQHPHHHYHPHHHQPPPIHSHSNLVASTGRTCPFETLLFFVNKIFKFFTNQDYCNMHLVYVTNGLLHTTDVIRQLEVLFKANLSLSFICIANTDCSFGYAADYTFMRFLARITHGYYAHVNDYLEYEIIENNRILLAHKHHEDFLLDDYQINETLSSADDLNVDILINQSNTTYVRFHIFCLICFQIDMVTGFRASFGQHLKEKKALVLVAQAKYHEIF